MRRTVIALSLSLAIAVAALVAACDDKSPIAPTPSVPPPVTAPALLRIEIVGPRSVAPGEIIQLGATGHFSDGSSRNVTNQATWHSQNGSVLLIDSTGGATGRQFGESIVTARAASLSSTAEVVVVPAGTFRLSVVVREAGSSFLDARLDVTDGRGAAFFDTTAVNGRFDVYGVAGDSQVRVTGAGYQDHVQRVLVADHVLLTVEMVALRPRVDVSGDYTLTIMADPTCRDRLPEDLQTRRYGARVTQLGPEVTVRLEGAALVTSKEWGGHFVGRMDGLSANVAFNLAVDFYYSSYYLNGAFLYPPDVFERLGGQRYLGIRGSAVTQVSPRALSGILNGSFWITDMTMPLVTRTVAECRSAQHSLVLSR